MGFKRHVIKVGNSEGITLSRKLMERNNIKVGDTVILELLEVEKNDSDE